MLRKTPKRESCNLDNKGRMMDEFKRALKMIETDLKSTRGKVFCGYYFSVGAWTACALSMFYTGCMVMSAINATLCFTLWRTKITLKAEEIFPVELLTKLYAAWCLVWVGNVLLGWIVFINT